MIFKNFKNAVAAQFERMQKAGVPLLRSSITGDELWAAYLAAFPEGSDPIFRKRTEHDCSSCRNFVRGIGSVVVIIDGKLQTIWDVTIKNEPEYQVVADALAAKVRTGSPTTLFFYHQPTVGVDKNFEQMISGEAKTWHHFHVNLDRKFVLKGADIPSTVGEKNTTFAVMQRALEEIDTESVETVLDLISQNSLYRGAEHKYAVTEFLKLKKAYAKLKTPLEKIEFLWKQVLTASGAVTHFKNSVIGTLVYDIATGTDLEDAVRMFESKVAPTNYKRPTALVTKKMIDSAKKTIEEMGLTSALQRRYAVIDDINVNNVLFVDRGAAQHIGGGDVFAELASTSKSVKRPDPKSFDRLEEIGIDKFLADVLPRATSLEVFVENRMKNNFVTLVAPSDPTAKNMFKWNNNFSWSYNGEVADSIKERVKSAGGNVTGDLCCRLAWFNYDDLDFHLVEPSGDEISFSNRRSRSGGQLDVDMNAGGGHSRTPVENIFYQSQSMLKEGVYRLFVHQFNNRDAGRDPGFSAQIDFMGKVLTFNYQRAIPNKDKVEIAKFRYSKANGLEIISSLPSQELSQEVWKTGTQDFRKVSVVMHSPNYWDGEGIGNKHTFFMIDGAKAEDTVRGFFNEFLNEDLNKHRKVLELIGSKMKAEEVADYEHQLSGVGFSSTVRDHVILRVTGATTRLLKVVF